MPNNFADVFSDDAFSALSLTAAVNEIDHIPGLAGQLAFAGTAASISTTKCTIERQGETLALIPTTARGAPDVTVKADKRNMIAFEVPHLGLSDTIYPSQIQDVREFGTSNELRSVESVVNERMQKLTRMLDLTLEHLRLGALKGEIRDADGSVMFNLFEEFGVLNSQGQPAPETFTFFDNVEESFVDSVRVTCHAVTRFMNRNRKLIAPEAQVWALCGDNFFDSLVEHPSVKSAYDGYGAAAQRLGDNYVSNTFEFGGIYFRNYDGTDDAATVAIETNEARFFLRNVPGLFMEKFAPADILATVNSEGLPRYAAVAVDPEFGRWAKLRVESNPLPLCVRPKTLVRGVVAEGNSESE